MEKLVEVVLNNVSTYLNEEQFNFYKNNSNYRVIMESGGRYRILCLMNG